MVLRRRRGRRLLRRRQPRVRTRPRLLRAEKGGAGAHIGGGGEGRWLVGRFAEALRGGAELRHGSGGGGDEAGLPRQWLVERSVRVPRRVSPFAQTCPSRPAGATCFVA
ncbi:hypothetical protein PR202_gb06434 [Eleusine coracana subsp. coracana]|uniref:Uncharacterized protein n=1 Tax=Eleusine coracana subsp. coracana TaxID=191504 RepID=A0AAV5E9K7_ELECO|nr:hypothetical protein PR202_gb06434 [Eleusine coracana subsp. coracana]